MSKYSPITGLAPRLKRNWHAASGVIPPAAPAERPVAVRTTVSMRGTRLRRSAPISRGSEIAGRESRRRTCGVDDITRLRPQTRCDPSLSFTGTVGTAAVCIALTWRGLYTPRAAASRNNKSGTKSCMPETFQKSAPIIGGGSTTRNEPRSRRSAPSSRSAERAALLWAAQRNHIAARRGNACRSRSAALNAVRRCSTASAPALRAASLCHACTLHIWRIENHAQPSGFG